MNLITYAYQGKIYITDGIKMWVYDNGEIKETEFIPIIKVGD